jgi:ubiquitin-like modifier-activating enzyme ATG7
MDAVAIATSSVELNIRLMRWRLMPSLQPELVASQRCLLIGAGTLGCAVARCLLGWGVKTITLVDSGMVSYSNPVRQSLFTHEECIGGQTTKAPAAAAALRRIFPGVQAQGVVLGIPMPGHPVGGNEVDGVRKDAAALEELIASHDAIFLLTDTRESRWLPTLLATVLRKPTFTTALGFDTFVVMRHGLPPATDDSSAVIDAPVAATDSLPPPDDTAAASANSSAASDSPSAATGDTSTATDEFSAATHAPSATTGSGRRPRLGCYFCNDVVAPANSMTRRTLDQQCTVSRPGLSMVASALAVELLVTLLHHPKVLSFPPAPPKVFSPAPPISTRSPPNSFTPHGIPE